MWIVNYIREWKAWREVKRVYKQNQNEFEKIGLKMNWFGILWKVINRDPKYKLGTQEDEVLLRGELAELNDFLVQHDIMDILAFELTPQEESNEEYFENSYLITFTPCYRLDKQYVSFKSKFWLFFGTCALATGLYFLITLL